jgi:hypothetical protein
VTRENEQRRVRAAFARPQLRLVAPKDGSEGGRHQRLEMPPDLGLVEALGADVDEVERAPAEAVCKRAHRAERTARKGGAYFRP